MRSICPTPRAQAGSGGCSGFQRRASVEMCTIRPSRTCAFTTQRPPQLWPQVRGDHRFRRDAERSARGLRRWLRGSWEEDCHANLEGTARWRANVDLLKELGRSFKAWDKTTESAKAWRASPSWRACARHDAVRVATVKRRTCFVPKPQWRWSQHVVVYIGVGVHQAMPHADDHRPRDLRQLVARVPADVVGGLTYGWV